MLEEYVSELNKKSDELQKNVTEIQELVHILCHDLLNPISCVIGMMEYYNDPNEMAEVMDAEGKELIVESLEQAINIIQMVRTMRALDSGKQKLSIQPVNLSSSLKTSLRMLRHRLTDKGITITSDVDKNHNVMAEEASLINSVMSNLITNSIKFSMEGSAVEIISQKDGEKVYMHVIDHGQGMSEEILKYIFDPSKPTTRPGTDGEKGTGFGMPLVKKFMEAYGGSISISSTLRKSGSDRHGTKITLTFKSAD
jgi:signal transduction histidine kinase